MSKYEIPVDVINRFGPFEKFKQDGSIVSVGLVNGKVIERVLLIYPNQVVSVQGEIEMSFNPKEVVRVFQTEVDLATRTSSSWSLFAS